MLWIVGHCIVNYRNTALSALSRPNNTLVPSNV